jgi:hypothetical protein
LLEDLQVQDFSIGHALKRSFYTDWLHSLERRPRPISSARAVACHFLTANFAHTGPRCADILILRAGKTARELLNFHELGTQLQRFDVAYASPYRHNDRHILSVLRAVRLKTKHHREAASLLGRLNRHRDRVFVVRREFDLPDTFDQWFWIEAERAVWRYIGALFVLARARPRVLVSAGDNQPVGYPFHTAARQLTIPSLVIQHGFIGQEWLHYPLWADRVCVWGEVDGEWYRHMGTAREKIAVTGNPRGQTGVPAHDRERARQRFGCSPDEFLLMWFTTPHGGGWKEQFVRWIRHPSLQALRLRILLKLHPKEQRADYEGVISGDHGLATASELDVASAFAAADAVVHDHSSIGAEASFTGQNVICASVNPPYPDYYRLLTCGQHLAESPEGLATIVRGLARPQLRPRPVPGLRYGGETALRAIASEIRSLI